MIISFFLLWSHPVGELFTFQFFQINITIVDEGLRVQCTKFGFCSRLLSYNVIVLRLLCKRTSLRKSVPYLVALLYMYKHKI